MDQKYLKLLKARKLLTVFSHLIRTLLFITTLASMSTLFIWVYRPDLITGLEKRIRDNYGNRFVEQNQKADSLLANNQLDEAYPILIKQLQELGEIKKLDRLKEQYVSTLHKLLFISAKRNDKDLALQVTQKLVAHDSSNVNFLIEHSKSLSRIGKMEDGESFLLKANKLSPTLPGPVEQLSEYYLKTNQKEKAREMLKDYLNANRHLLIELNVLNQGSYYLSHGFVPATGKPQIVRLKVSDYRGFLLKSYKLQLVFKDAQNLLVTIREISAKTPFGTLKIAPEDLDIDLSAATRRATGVFVLHGEYPSKTEYPSIKFTVPDQLVNKALEELNLEAELTPTFTPMMKKLYGEAQ